MEPVISVSLLMFIIPVMPT